ncbi:hypothetical protein TAMA11512_07640 [Selenomonas sp. TAMA-11512]|nr:hypothetical protein TAMA11512_07640 [Selenomonas sp. TAMA-11512]
MRGCLPMHFWITVSIWLVYGLVLSNGAALSGIVFLLLALLLWLPVYARSSALQRWMARALPAGIREGLYMGSAVLLVYAALIRGRLVVGSPVTVTMIGDVLEPVAFYALFGAAAAMGAYAAGYTRSAALGGMLASAAAAWVDGFLAFPVPCFGVLPLTLPLAVPLDVPAEPAAWIALPVLFLAAAAFYVPDKAPKEATGTALASDRWPRGRRAADTAALLLPVLFYPVVEEIAYTPALLTGAVLVVGMQAFRQAGRIRALPIDTRPARAAFLVGSMCLPLSFSLTAGLSLMYIAYVTAALPGGGWRTVSGAVLVLALLSLVQWISFAP